MKKLFAMFGLLAFLAVPAQSFAWEYDGLSSLNPFTNFGRGFGGNNCCCQKVEKCKKPKLTKCEKLHGYKLVREGNVCGCAAPIIIEEPVMPTCEGCQRAF